jgi:hypothetical protein
MKILDIYKFVLFTIFIGMLGLLTDRLVPSSEIDYHVSEKIMLDLTE